MCVYVCFRVQIRIFYICIYDLNVVICVKLANRGIEAQLYGAVIVVIRNVEIFID